MDLPPGAEYRNGQLVRAIPKTAADGRKWKQIRPVSLDRAEARAKRMDFYHSQLGWLREGYKLVTDRSVGSKMLDESQAVAAREEDRQEMPVTQQAESEAE